MIAALSLDAAGTLLHLREPVAATYARLGRRSGVERSVEEIAAGFSAAMRSERSGPRHVGDGRAFWRRVVTEATGCADPAYFEAVYAAFGAPAWSIAPGALAAMDRIRAAGVRIAIVSNWDTRLRPTLADLGVLAHVDAAIISGELGVEKPDPRIFEAACRALSVSPGQAVHVGDSRRADVAGARAAGLAAWHFGTDVATFDDIADRILG